MSYRSPISKARGKGSAQSGVHHWMSLRLGALALIPLSIWFVAFVIQLIGTGMDRTLMVELIAQPCHSLMLIFFLLASFHHAAFGIQEVIEDYISHELRKIIAIMLVKLACAFAAIVGIFAILSIYFKG